MEYLDALPPCLSDFSISCTDIEISKSPNESSCIKKLSIGCNALSEELVNFISGFFPKLYNLHLIGGAEGNITIDLSSKYLENLSIFTWYEEASHGFSVDSTDGSPVKYFVGSENMNCFSHEGNLSPVTPEELQDRATTELPQNSNTALKKFKF
jgi:hypothetical protein